MIERLLSTLPSSLRLLLRRLYYLPSDLLYHLTAGADSLVPPKSMTGMVGGGGFEKVGREFMGYFIELGGLRPDDRVLDVGCGVGRMAIPLTEYLSPKGGYWGFDIIAREIRWCRTHITPQFGHFHFRHVDIYNRHYNPRGTVRPRDFRFPYEDDFFDFVFLTSVFTHMLPGDVAHYLDEIARVLKVGGRCMATFFVLNDESKALIRAGRSTLPFRYEVEGCLTLSTRDPEAAVAYEEEAIFALLSAAGLRLSPPIHYGSWCGRENFLSYQDIVVAVKEAPVPSGAAVA